MGLAGPKKNTKISADPRNTHWATNTDRFGHKILESYGWTPGSALGDTTSAHHAHLTSASHTGIKVMLKDDFLGIGAKKGSKDDECTGLDVFQNLLGRLNGKSEAAIERDIAARYETKKNIIIGERYRMRFVEGGIYVSSDIEQLIAAQAALKVGDETRPLKTALAEHHVPTSSNLDVYSESGDANKKISKKRKVSQLEDAKDEGDHEDRSKKERRDKKRAKRDKKEEKRKSRKSTSKKSSESSSDAESSEQKDKDKKMRKREKKDRKSRPSKKRSSSSSSIEESESESVRKSISTPTAVLTGRHAIRHRYIMAKKSAVMDSKALNEIFMVKA